VPSVQDRLIDGKYRLGDVLRETGRAVVYRAEHVGIERFVEVKTIPLQMPSDGPDAKRLEREARAVGSVAHRNVQSIVDSGNDSGGRPFIVYEALEGSSLATLLRDHPDGLPKARAAQLMLQVVEGLCAVHEGGVVHRLVSPESVVVVAVNPGGDLVKLTRFDEAAFVGVGEIPEPIELPPRAYRAPEIHGPSAAVSRAADLFGAGVLLRALLTGSTEPGASVSDTAIRAIERATARRPEERFPETRLFLDAISLLVRKDGRPAREELATPVDPLEADLQYLKLRRDTSAGERRAVGEGRVHLLVVLLIIEAIYRELGEVKWAELVKRVPEIEDLLPGAGNTEVNRRMGIAVTVVSNLLAAADAVQGRGDLGYVSTIGQRVAVRALKRLLPNMPDALEPHDLVDNVPTIWRAITKQGRVTVLEKQPNLGVVAVSGQVEPALELSALMAGVFRGLLRNGRAPRGEVQITSCEALGDAATVFRLTW
jgi:serine/threonine protein kinase